MKRKSGSNNFGSLMRKMPAGGTAAGEEKPPQPDPIANYIEKGNQVKVMEPKFAEGYAGHCTQADLNRRRKEIIEGK